MKTFPTLYKKTSTGAIQLWTIEANTWSSPGDVTFGVIRTRHGQVDGKIQMTEDIIRTGKNAGRKNETTPVQQAEAEAQAKWEKQLKKGYVKTLDEAQAGTVDEIIEGGVACMLAQSFDKHAAKINWPAYLSPKLDGIRCIAVVKQGKATLWSRTRKAINSCPHIVKALETSFPGDVCESIVLDGELYHPDYKDDFNKIISLVRPDEPVDGHEIVQYHVFDVVDDRPFSARYQYLKSRTISPSVLGAPLSDPLVLVPQYRVEHAEHALAWSADFMAEGYEGGMIKNLDSPYEHKRSYHIQKIKSMQDAEFAIVAAEEGRGKLTGHVGAFVCKTEAGVEFKAKLKGSLDNLKRLFENPAEWQGKKLTVQFQNLTPDGIPRFPVGKALRDYE